MMITGLFAQSIVGVVNEDKTPLQGANIVVAGTELGAVSDNVGSYVVLNIPAGTYDVTASFIGYSSVTTSVVVGK